jgi:anthranilate/para-aminobenzoate synthase component I
MQLRKLMKQVEDVQNEAESAAAVVGALPHEMEELEDTERDQPDDDNEEPDVDMLLTAEIDDPKLKEQLRQLRERRARMEELQRELDNSKHRDNSSEKAKSENEDDNYVDTGAYTKGFTRCT